MMSPDDPHDWNEITRRATDFTHRRLKRKVPLHVAERIALDALTTLFRKAAPTDEESDESILVRLGSIINGDVRNYWRTKSALANDGFVQVDGAVPADRNSDVEERLDGQVAIGLLLARIDGDELLTEMVMLHLEGVWKPKEIAKQLGRDVHDIYNANRRLDEHFAAVRSTLGSGS